MHEEPLNLVPKTCQPSPAAPLTHRYLPVKDEKNQDSTELTGDINFPKIRRFGSEGDPRRSVRWHINGFSPKTLARHV
jgi:hypothetical protein